MTSRSLGHRAPLLWLVITLMAGLAAGQIAEIAPPFWLLLAALTAAVRRSSLLTSEQSKGVRMSFTATQLTLSSSSPDVGDSEITMPLEGFQGEPIEVGFNPGYIVDALKIIDAPEVTIELKATNKPGVLRIGQEFTYVIMPLNV